MFSVAEYKDSRWWSKHESVQRLEKKVSRNVELTTDPDLPYTTLEKVGCKADKLCEVREGPEGNL